MKSRINGTTMPVLELILEPGESVFAEAGELSWMSSSIQMATHTQMGGGGGIFGALKRVAGGGTLFMTEYSAQGAAGHVAFATKLPGHIGPVDVSAAKNYLIHRHGFLCGTTGIQIGVGFQQSLGAGVFGGAGFLLQKLMGSGTAWVELSGELVQRTLAPGENIRVHPGHVGMFESTINFQISMVKGVKNLLFGGDGIFLASLTGPGDIWLQTLPIAHLAHAIQPYMAGGEAATGGAAGGVVGAILRGLTRD